MKLIIVESPGKTTKIQSYAGSDYTVKASVGHILDLPPKRLGVDIENNFEPEYVDIDRQKKIIAELGKLIKKSDEIILAADLDREGEMIAWSIAHRFKLKKPQRITFDAITKEKISEALKQPRDINYNLVNAQTARRVLDRLIGYKLSPLVQKHVNYQAKSAGRVQSVVVKLIIEKENEIEDFFKKEEASFFKINGDFYFSKDNIFKTILYHDKDILKLTERKKIDELMQKFKKSKYKVSDVFNKPVKSNPSPPFTTSTLLQEATNKLGMTSTTVKQSSQKLYNMSYITYIRTDTTELSGEAMGKLKKYIDGKFTSDYHKARNFKAKGKTQEAHEAIRPTNINIPELDMSKGLNNNDLKLYNLIWRRTVASQMKEAEFTKYILNIKASEIKDNYYFSFSYDKLIFPGYLKVYDPNYKNKMIDIKFPKKGDDIFPTKIIANEEFKSPPSRYSEASLINKLDPKNLNIGRPSTYNSIIDKIISREYVELTDIEGLKKDVSIITLDFDNSKINEEKKEIFVGNEKNKFKPTELGKMAIRYLSENFPKIMDYKFTASMEDNLDDIAIGKKEWRKVLKDFWKDFEPILIKQQKAKVDINKYMKVLGAHPDGYEIVATLGKYGPMLKMCITSTKCIYAPIKPPLTIDNITLKDAIKIFEYPKQIGKKGNKIITLNKGKFGLYFKFGKDKISIPNEKYKTPDDIDMKIFDELLEERNKKNLAYFEDERYKYQVLDGPYGKYIKMTDTKSKKKKNTSNHKLPENTDIEKLDLKKIKEIIDESFKNKFKKFKAKPKTGGRKKKK